MRPYSKALRVTVLLDDGAEGSEAIAARLRLRLIESQAHGVKLSGEVSTEPRVLQ